MIRLLCCKLLPVFVLIFWLIASGNQSSSVDPFYKYRDFIKAPLTIEKKVLTHYQAEEEMIREKLTLDLSKRERSILAGLHWLITFADEDKNFDFMFSDFLLLMNVLANSEDRIHQREVVNSIIKRSLARAENKLEKLYKPDENSRWSFICILQALSRFPQFHDRYFKFYQEFFKPANETENDSDLAEFSYGVKVGDYKLLFDYLVGASFLHFHLEKDKSRKAMFHEDKFTSLLKEFENFNYIMSHPVFSPQFRSLGYLVTHVILVLTNYGEFKITKSINQQKAEDYIESTLSPVRDELGDFDLFAEYVQCIKLLRDGKDSRLSELEKIIYDLQRPNGSWGSDFDFKTTPYTGIHPTGAALMALNQSNSGAFEK